MKLSDGEWLDWSWVKFTETVMYESRFNFLTAPKPKPFFDRILAAGDLLNGIGELVRHALVDHLPKGRRVYRTRVRGPTDFWNPGDPKQLGAPPRDKASAGRMNPAGIPHLYAAFDEETALREVVPAYVSPPTSVVQATFETKEMLTVLDLTDRVPLPRSEFDDQAQPLQKSMYFLAMFARDISLPAKDGAEHIEYAPTEIVSEYFSQVFEPGEPESRLDGPVYRSAAHLPGKNLVLFPGTHPTIKRRMDSLPGLVDWRVRRLEGYWDFDSLTRDPSPRV